MCVVVQSSKKKINYLETELDAQETVDFIWSFGDGITENYLQQETVANKLHIYTGQDR
jgi:hypothetical protein